MALLIVGSDRASEFFEETQRVAPGHDVRLWPDVGNVNEVESALAWHPPAGALNSFPNLKFIVSVGAGVDHLFTDPDLPEVPIVRYVDPDLTGRMTEYIALHTLFHSRRMLAFQELQRHKHWRYVPEPAAHQVRVGIMGLGVLGQDAARALLSLRYDVRGWSRTPKSVDGVTCFAGDGELDAFLAETDILVVLLPLTPDTSNIIDHALLAKLSTRGRHPRLPGPVLINAGRGGLQVETDILAALDTGALDAATLDVFQQEPLPSTSPLWTHPRIVITPHNAAESATESIVGYFMAQVHRHETGQPLENVVDREAGY